MVYRDNGNGSFATDDGKALEPGWKTYNGFKQFSKIVTDPLVPPSRSCASFVWTVVFAVVDGALLVRARPLPRDHAPEGASGQRVYRSLLVIPYAIPSFLTLLVWGGLLNTDFGIVNKILPRNIPWLFDPWLGEGLGHPRERLADVPVLLPRQPGRAAVDPGRTGRGGKGGRRGRLAGLPPDHAAAAAHLDRAADDRVVRVQLQQLQQHLPADRRRPSTNDQSVAGATDILISYTYKLAFSAGQGQQYSTARARSRSSSSSSSARSRHRVLEDEGAGDAAMTTVEQAELASGTPSRSARAAAGGRSRGRTWWRHLVAIAGIVFALFPVVYVTGAAFNADPDARRGECEPRPAGRHPGQLQDDPVDAPARPDQADRPLRLVVPELDHHSRRLGLLQRAHGRDGRLCVRALPLQGPPRRDADAAADPDVPGVPRAGRDLPDPAEHRRRLPVRGPDESGVDPRLPGRSLRSEHLAHEGVLRHDPDGAGRIRARRRSDADADLLGRDPAPCRPRAGGDHAHLLRLHAERVRDRQLRPAEGRLADADRRPPPVHRRQIREELGAVRRRRPADRDRADARSSSRSSATSSRASPAEPSRDDGDGGDARRRCSRQPHHDGSYVARGSRRARRRGGRPPARSARDGDRRRSRPLRLRRAAARRDRRDRRGDRHRGLVDGAGSRSRTRP